MLDDGDLVTGQVPSTIDAEGVVEWVLQLLRMSAAPALVGARRSAGPWAASPTRLRP